MLYRLKSGNADARMHAPPPHLRRRGADQTHHCYPFQLESITQKPDFFLKQRSRDNYSNRFQMLIDSLAISDPQQNISLVEDAPVCV